MLTNSGTFYTWEGNCLRLNVLGSAGAKQNRIGKVKDSQLKIAVTTAPEKGKATQAMIKFLAREFAVKISDIELVFGQTSPNKQFLIHNPQKLPTMIKQPD